MTQEEEIKALKTALEDAQETIASYSRRTETVDAMWLELGYILDLNQLEFPMDVDAIRRKVADLVGKREVLDALEKRNQRYANRNLYTPGDLPIFTQKKVLY